MRYRLKGALAAMVGILTVIGVACSSAGPETAPSTPQEPLAVASSPVPATVIAVQPSPTPSAASTPRPTSAPVTNADTATATATPRPSATAEPMATVQEATSSPVPTETSVPITSNTALPSPTPEPSAANPVIIPSKIEDFAFEDLEVGAGTILNWFNKDNVPHTVTAGSPAEPQPALFDSGSLSKGEQYSFIFHEAGSFQFYCVFHPRRMVATITVVENP